MFETGANPAIRPPAPKRHIPTNSALTVTFGRDALGEPMSDTSWELFDEMIRSSINDLLHPVKVFGPFDGEGEWDGETEQSRTYVVIVGYPCGVTEWDERLATLARIFDQEAIAYHFGDNILVYGKETTEAVAA